MASLSKSKSKDGNNRYEIEFESNLGKRVKIRLNHRHANENNIHSIKNHIEALIRAAHSGSQLEKAPHQWEQSIGIELHQKLVNAGMAKTRQLGTLKSFIEAFIGTLYRLREWPVGLERNKNMPRKRGFSLYT
jgi:hypothetical protein